MSAANFETMRDFSLFAKNYVVEMKRCKVCGSIMEAGPRSAITVVPTSWKASASSTIWPTWRTRRRSPPRWTSSTMG